MSKTPQQPPQPGPIDVPRNPGQAGTEDEPATPGRNPGSNPDNPGDDPKVREPQRLPDVVATDEPSLPDGQSGARNQVRS